MIKLNNLTKIYGNGETAVKALNNINVEIQDNSLTAIIGQSGSGKTTMLNIIGGLDTQTSGEALINGQDISKLNSSQLARFRNKNIGFVFQSYFLEPNFTALDNVEMPLCISGVKKIDRRELAKKALESVGLIEKINKKASELSGGEKQRVSIARALVSNPQIILADEPTGNLDSKNGDEIMKILKEIAKTKIVVLVTHNQSYAKLCDHIITISDGKITGVVDNNDLAR